MSSAASPLATPSADIALVTERRYVANVAAADDWYLANILSDDAHLREALLHQGLTSARVDWANPLVDWSGYRCALFRTTWDYYHRFAEFAAWLKQVESQTLLLNDSRTVWWNLDKHYLTDLRSHGVHVVSSTYIERGSHATLPELLGALGWDEAVVKPCVSGAARHTYRVTRANAAEIDRLVRPLLAAESLMLQPFQREIVSRGEMSFMIFAGQFSHAVLKVAKPGDFRVQDDHGGMVHDYSPTSDEIEFAECAMASCGTSPAYGRIDMIRDNEGRLAVTELELIEPELWLRRAPTAATAFAAAVATRIAKEEEKRRKDEG